MKAPELPNHIPVPSLPEHLGGTSQYSHVAWIQSCINAHANTIQGDKQDHDCVGSLLRSYSLECSNSSTSATLSHGNTQLGPAANSNCYDDSNANPHNHCGALEGRTRDNRPQGNHHHWNGSAVSAANAVVLGSCGPNANTNGHGRQAPPQSDTPPDTPLSQKSEGDAADDRTAEAEDGEQEEDVPPLPQKSLPRPPHQPYSQSPQLSSSWGPDDNDDDDERYREVSVHMPEQGGMTVRDLVAYVKRKKKKGIYQEYEDIRKEPPAGAFDYSKYESAILSSYLSVVVGEKCAFTVFSRSNFRKLANQIKNRYSDVLCLDQSRVRLCQLSDDEDEVIFVYLFPTELPKLIGLY